MSIHFLLQVRLLKVSVPSWKAGRPIRHACEHAPLKLNSIVLGRQRQIGAFAMTITPTLNWSWCHERLGLCRLNRYMRLLRLSQLRWCLLRYAIRTERIMVDRNKRNAFEIRLMVDRCQREIRHGARPSDICPAAWGPACNGGRL